ncbi:unnamed protein product [Adineta steineri]|uniref:Uncharacterized protein n=1 Tax=Adineta steineri TaxID=433720 RepID=A0A814UH72_9BILA|nr:unnamed protein product [Adineta steineri]CAF1174406.1 unnamed protein product [Adineta steineri]
MPALSSVVLVGGTPTGGWGVTRFGDDENLAVTVPFAISMYGYSTTTPYVNCNGGITLGNCPLGPTNNMLPYTTSCPGPIAAGFWYDFEIQTDSSQSISYGTIGTSPNRNLVFDFKEVPYDVENPLYHFQIVFYENSPGIVRYYYYEVSSTGATATIGVQNDGGSLYQQYSYNQAGSVPAGTSGASVATLILTFNTNTNTYISTIV